MKFFKRLWSKLFGNNPKRVVKPTPKPVVVKVDIDKVEVETARNLRHWKIARGHLGVKEIRGANHNPVIVGFFQKVVGYALSDETAWCSAFVGAVLYMAGLPNTGKLNARSYLDYGTVVSEPKQGDIVIFWRGSPDSWKGHVAFFSHFDEYGNIVCLGGNQSNKVCYATYDEARVLGYRRV